MDYWFAECVPCGWREKYATEDVAIAAAEAHIEEHHRGVPATVRAQQVIGHVQLRSDDAPQPAEAVVPETSTTLELPGVTDPELGM